MHLCLVGRVCIELVIWHFWVQGWRGIGLRTQSNSTEKSVFSLFFQVLVCKVLITTYVYKCIVGPTYTLL